MILTLIDADSIMYATCFHCAKDDENSNNFNYYIDNFYERLDKILLATKADKYMLFITNGPSFRTIGSNYKKDRKSKEPPKFITELKKVAVEEGAYYVEYLEADDLMAIADHRYSSSYNIILAHIDSDLNQIIGRHYNYRKDEFYDLSEKDVARYTARLLLTGSHNNVGGLPECGEKTADKYLDKADLGLLSIIEAYIQGISKEVYSTYKNIRGYGCLGGLQLFKSTFNQVYLVTTEKDLHYVRALTGKDITVELEFLSVKPSTDNINDLL